MLAGADFILEGRGYMKKNFALMLIIAGTNSVSIGILCLLAITNVITAVNALIGVLIFDIISSVLYMLVFIREALVTPQNK